MANELGKAFLAVTDNGQREAFHNWLSNSGKWVLVQDLAALASKTVQQGKEPNLSDILSQASEPTRQYRLEMSIVPGCEDTHKKIATIKEIRNYTSMSLKEAKDISEGCVWNWATTPSTMRQFQKTITPFGYQINILNQN